MFSCFSFVLWFLYIYILIYYLFIIFILFHFIPPIFVSVFCSFNSYFSYLVMSPSHRLLSSVFLLVVRYHLSHSHLFPSWNYSIISLHVCYCFQSGSTSILCMTKKCWLCISHFYNVFKNFFLYHAICLRIFMNFSNLCIDLFWERAKFTLYA